MKKILISGYYGFNNFGDDAILGVLTNHLKGQDVTVLTANAKQTSVLYGVKVIPSFDTKQVMENISKFDLLISGGGSLLQNVTSNRSLMYYTSLIMLMNTLKKDVVIFAQGIGPINGFWGTSIAKSALKKCKCISVRDEDSVKLLKSWKIESNLVCDPAFELKLPKSKKTRKIGIQLRKFHNLTDELFDNIIIQLGSRYSDREIELISFQDAQDIGISEVFYNKVRKKYPTMKISIKSGLTFKQIINTVGEYDIFIAMRYHACLLGLKYGIKTLPICYDPKVKILAENAKIPYLVMESKNNDYKLIFDKLSSLSQFNLMSYANSQVFDWSMTGIDELINS